MWQGVWGEKGAWARWIALLSSGQAAAVDWSVESSLPLLPVTFLGASLCFYKSFCFPSLLCQSRLFLYLCLSLPLFCLSRCPISVTVTVFPCLSDSGPISALSSPSSLGLCLSLASLCVCVCVCVVFFFFQTRIGFDFKVNK